MPKRLRYDTLIKDLPPNLLAKAEKLRKAKVPVYKIAEALQAEQNTDIAEFSAPSSTSLPNPFINTVTTPTRANSNHSYYQYIHPVKLADKVENFEYAFFIVSKNGTHCRSNNYADRAKCHADLKAYLEDNLDVPLITVTT